MMCISFTVRIERHRYSMISIIIDDIYLYISIKYQTYQSACSRHWGSKENTWMSQNRLNLNADDRFWHSVPHRCTITSIPSITVNGVIIPVLNEPVGNLGAVFDPNMNIIMSAHVSKVINSNYSLSDSSLAITFSIFL